MFNLDDCLAFVTSQSGKVFSETLEDKLRPYKVTRAQWIAMHYIYDCKDITQRELADKLSVKQPTVVRLIQALELKGYLQRSGSDEDKRKKYLKLKAQGVEVYKQILPVVEEFKKDTIAGISQEHLVILKDTLNLMIKNASSSRNN